MKYTFVCVCQEGPLEIQARLLAASLVRNLRCEHRLIAALPEPAERWGRPAEDTLDFLRDSGFELVPIQNEVRDDLPVTNKIACLGLEHDGDVTVFLDTDMLALRPFEGSPELEADFAARPAGFDCYRAEAHERWRRLYESLGLSLPTGRVVSTGTRESMPPYFNAGFVATRRAASLAARWRESCHGVLAVMSDPESTFYVDQIALAVAVQALGLEFQCLEEAYNFPCFVSLVDPTNPPYFAHYHSVEFLVRDPFLHGYCRGLLEEFPAAADGILADKDWRALGLPRWRARLSHWIARGLWRDEWRGRTHAMTVGAARRRE